MTSKPNTTPKANSLGNVSAGELVASWDEYLAYCNQQMKQIHKMNAKILRDHQKESKQLRKALPPSVTIQRPRLWQSLHETPSFPGFIEWLRAHHALNNGSGVSEVPMPSPDLGEGKEK